MSRVFIPPDLKASMPRSPRKPKKKRIPKHLHLSDDEIYNGKDLRYEDRNAGKSINIKDVHKPDR